MTPEETWQKACVIAGLWTPNQRCVPSVTNPCDRDDHWPEAHFIECPPVGDPAATVKMLEWLISRELEVIELLRFDSNPTYGVKTFHRISTYRGDTLPDALAAAIVPIGEPDATRR